MTTGFEPVGIRFCRPLLWATQPRHHMPAVRLVGGSDGIRTRGGISVHSRFQDGYIKPLCHASKSGTSPVPTVGGGEASSTVHEVGASAEVALMSRSLLWRPVHQRSLCSYSLREVGPVCPLPIADATGSCFLRGSNPHAELHVLTILSGKAPCFRGWKARVFFLL